ncbi:MULTISPECIES: NuoM family protein [Roseiflexus]|jgi:NADH-quinone oxidoreductase subunit M|uniref:Proton-translocating NADH-quinone oxidoreductase, chain M n=1 Tax=Roseiflexus castenholzii (strain DSM 13941 / HLO8) TaxID=383372 RepID=A7NL14_ROSCS|nr:MULTISPECIES: NADH-quinone oxidoreductase subunit M [Roseiflexus]ABU58184.1 proton-translocating NADH-quinone oxidoreductase, chain M [Roseiflexus castenholzii DSM 13941]GIW01107.1 MAG: NADH dehydrogenase subunit M [Roseiflexus sp.]
MNLIDLPANVPWLSLIWLSLVIPTLIIALLKPEQKQEIRIVGAVFAFISLALTLLVYLAYDYRSPEKFQFLEETPWLPELGINYILGVDGISLPMLLLNGLVIFTGALISWNIEERTREYWALLLLLAAGVYGVFVSLDLFLLFIFYELAVLPMYLLIGIWGSTRKEYGAMKLTLYLMGGSAFIILGMVAVYFSGTLRTFDMRLLAQSALFTRDVQIIFFVPLFLGFAVLAGMFPFHTWSPTGHVAAPTAVSMLHAGVLMKLGAYGCLRVAMWIFPEGANYWLLPIAIATLINAVYGATIAMTQRDFKFMIGYSSVSHMGLTLMGLAAANTIGMTGAVLQMFAHGVMTALFFAVVGRMVYDRTHTRQFPELGGLFAVMPFAAIVFIIAGLSSMGMPGLAGFWAEFNIFMGMWQRFPLIAVLAGISIPITAGYILIAVYRVFFGELKNPEFRTLPKLTAQEYAAGVILVVVLIISGIYPAYLTEPIEASVQPIAEALARAGTLGMR